MLTVNSAKQCPYCTGLHGELARMAGVEDSLKLNGATSVEECRELVDEQAIVGVDPSIGEALEATIPSFVLAPKEIP